MKLEVMRSILEDFYLRNNICLGDTLSSKPKIWPLTDKFGISLSRCPALNPKRTGFFLGDAVFLLFLRYVSLALFSAGREE